MLNLISRNTFNDGNEVFEAVYAHIIMEMVCIGEKHLARLILDEQKELLVPNWYQDLWAVLYEGKLPFTLEKSKAVDEASAAEQMPDLESDLVQNSRKMLAKLAKQKLVVLKPVKDKLIDLVMRAKSRHTGTGDGRSADMIVAERPPRLGYI